MPIRRSNGKLETAGVNGTIVVETTHETYRIPFILFIAATKPHDNERLFFSVLFHVRDGETLPLLLVVNSRGRLIDRWLPHTHTREVRGVALWS